MTAKLTTAILLATSMTLAMPLTAAAQTVTGTLADDPDPTGDGNASPGEQIDYTATLNAAGGTAQNVMYDQILDANTTLVPGSLNTSPIAIDDAYQVIANLTLSIPAGNGLLANDRDPDNAPPTSNAGLSATAETKATSLGGSVTINADGSFDYDAPVGGFAGTDTFQYTVGDSHAVNPLTDTATASISVAATVWYMDDNPAGTADEGTIGNPFLGIDSLNAAQGAGATDVQAGDMIFVFEGTYNSPGIDLQNNQTLIGQGATAVEILLNGATVIELPAGTATNPNINNLTGNAIDLAANNTIRNLDLNPQAGKGLNGTNVGNLVVSGVNIGATGGAAVDIVGATSLDVALGNVASTNSATRGINLQNIASAGSSFTVAGTTTTSGSTGDGINIDPSEGTYTFTGKVDIDTSTGRGLVLDDVGTVVMNNAANEISTLADKAIDANTVDSLSATFAMVDVGYVAGSSPNGGISLQNVTGTTTIANATISVTGGNGFFANNGGTVNVLDGTIGATGTPALSFTDTTIGATGLTFESISADGGTNGILLNNTGALGGLTVTGDGSNARNGSGGTIQNTTGSGIDLDNTQDFSISSMDIDDTGLGAGGTDGDEDHIDAREIRGTNLVRGCRFTDYESQGAASRGIEIENNGVSLVEFRVTDCLFDESLGGGSAFRADLEAGTVNGHFVIEDSRFEDHSGPGVDFAIGEGGPGSGSIDIVIENNIFDGRSDAVIGNDITIAVQDDYAVHYVVHDNSLDEIKPVTTAAGIINSVTGANNAPGPSVTARITENDIREIRGRRGINMIVGDNFVSAWDITIYDNDINDLVSDASCPGANCFGLESVEIEIEDNAGSGDLRVIGNRFGTVTPVAGNGSREALNVFTRDDVSVDMLVHDNIMTISNISSGEAIELDIEDTSDIDLTVTNNTLTGGSQNEGFTIETEDPGSVANVRFGGIGGGSAGNTSADEIQFDRDAGTMTITRRDFLAADNPGVTGPFSLVDAPLTTPALPALPSGVILATNGAAQIAAVSTAFSALEVTVLNPNGTPAAGVAVTFAAPGAGASGVFTGGAVAVTNASGVATKGFTANATAGAYEVTASAAGFDGAKFLMRNE